jgi:fructose-1,6-bisphosphatase I
LLTPSEIVILLVIMGFPLRFSQVTLSDHTALLHEPALAHVLAQIGLVGKLVTQDLRRAGLANILGTTGETNVQGEVVKKLDELANDSFLHVFERTGEVSGLASEEMPHPVIFEKRGREARYLLLVDPLDGSTNTDCNMPLGAIFSVLRYDRSGDPVEEDFLQTGVRQVAAGYLLYGSSTLLVYSQGQGVHGFTLDPGIGEYVLSHAHIRMPLQGKVYAANEGNYHQWPAGVRRYCDYLKIGDKPTGRPYSARYSGCLVADVHRLLVGGGIYLYPGEVDKPEGKLRLLYEANPLGFIVEQAGGRASTGTERILELEPKTLHQRVPLFIGSRHDVDAAEAFIQGRV